MDGGLIEERGVETGEIELGGIGGAAGGAWEIEGGSNGAATGGGGAAGNGDATPEGFRDVFGRTGGRLPGKGGGARGGMLLLEYFDRSVLD